MSDNLTANNGNDANLDANQANQGDTNTGNESNADASQSQPGSDEGQKEGEIDYKQKFSDSSREAQRLAKEAQELKSQQELSDLSIQVAVNEDKIHEINGIDSAKADKISQKLWGKTYQEYAGTTNDDTNDEQPQNVEATVQKVLKQQEQKQQESQIEELETEFFVNNAITVGSDLYNNIMKDYNTFKPGTSDNAKRILEMSYKTYTANEPVTNNISNAATSFSSSGNYETGQDDAKAFNDYNLELSKAGVSPMSKDAYDKAKAVGIL